MKKIYWVGFRAPSRVTKVVDHPDKVWEETGDSYNSQARGWKLLRVEKDGTPITMVGCTGSCGSTKPDWEFEVNYVDLREVYTCRHCGGRGELEPINFTEELYDRFNRAQEAYLAAKEEMDTAMRTMSILTDEINDMWNFTHTVEDMMI